MGGRKCGERASANQIAEDMHMLIDVCRLIARRTPSTGFSEELFDLADLLDREVERLRQSATGSVG